jgi:hypothetical protein
MMRSWNKLGPETEIVFEKMNILAYEADLERLCLLSVLSMKVVVLSMSESLDFAMILILTQEQQEQLFLRKSRWLDIS